jgi:hypothetical protein
MTMKNLGFLGLDGYCVTQDGKIYSLKSNRFLKTNVCKKGYVRISLWNGYKPVTHTVHRLVAMAYIPQQDYTLQVNHIDGNKLNNHYKNLEWVTLQENIQHSVEHGLRDSQKLYTDEQICNVCRLLENGLRNKDIADMTGVHLSKISMIRNGLAYQHISCEYLIPVNKASSRISLDKILKICEMLQEGVSPRDVHKVVGVGYQTVRYIKRREAYTEISKNYHW